MIGFIVNIAVLGKIKGSFSNLVIGRISDDAARNGGLSNSDENTQATAKRDNTR